MLQNWVFKAGTLSDASRANNYSIDAGTQELLLPVLIRLHSLLPKVLKKVMSFREINKTAITSTEDFKKAA